MSTCLRFVVVCSKELLFLFRDLENDQAVLLLYLFLHKNPAFQKYILHSKDLECLVSVTDENITLRVHLPVLVGLTQSAVILLR